MDFLVAATAFGDAPDDAPAVIGVVAGSWIASIAGRVPDGTTVSVWTHEDPTGDALAQRIAESLSDRCDVVRGVFPSLPTSEIP